MWRHATVSFSERPVLFSNGNDSPLSTRRIGSARSFGSTGCLAAHYEFAGSRYTGCPEGLEWT